MDNEETVQEEIIDSVEDAAVDEKAYQAEIEALKKELAAAQIRTELLLAGVLREKLDEGAAIAEGLYAAGKTPIEAAIETAENYPHLKAVKQEIPQFAAGGSGALDGFAAIRRIFAGR